ncbi:MAG TPA: LamG-like jellyroll fold domain-containing protein [Acidimicrobiales bacterium]|nr:LamG-like jellyroll fold domain-containing protein [Acidimicrobiales bacterium]
MTETGTSQLGIEEEPSSPSGVAQPNGEPEPDPIFPELRAWLTSPTSRDVSGAEPGVAVPLSGEYVAEYVSGVSVSVDVDGTTYPATLGGTATAPTWQSTVRFYRAGSVAVTVRAKGTSTVYPIVSLDKTSAPVTFNVTHTSAVPKLTIDAPKPGDMPISEGGQTVTVRALTSAQFGPRTMFWECEGRRGTELPVQGTTWSDRLRLAGLPLGARSITVCCRDAVGNEGRHTVVVTAIDVTPPRLEVSQPAPFQDFLGAAGGIVVSVRGRAWDGQSGMVGGKVEVYVNGVATPVTTSDNWANWSASPRVNNYGTFTVGVRAVDKAGREQTIQLPIQVISDYRPRDLAERLDARGYLAALVLFARDHVKVGGGQLSSADLEAALGQPFGRLSQPLSETRGVGDQSVNQLQLVAEVLRRHRTAGPRLLVAHWSFDAGTVTGTAIADQSGGNMVAELKGGAALEAGVGGGAALRCKAGTEYAQVSNAPSLEVGRDDGDFSVSFFIQPTTRPATPGPWRGVTHKGNTGAERTFAMWLRPESNRLHARISTTSDSNEGLDSAADVATGTWTHVAYVKSGKQLRLYLDGRLDTAVTLKGKSVANSGPIYLGRSADGSGFDGLIEDFRIYARPLSETSVKALAAPAPQTALASILAAGEAAYRWEAYEAYLAGIGTSFDELRSARGADSATRTALATRLGIDLSATAPDELTQLSLEPTSVTEARLEQLFGLRDTDAARDTLRQPLRPLLLQWRESALARRWAQDDRSEQAAARAFAVVVEPDLISAADVVSGSANSAAQNLLNSRQQQVATIRAQLQTAGGGPAKPLEHFQSMLAMALPGVDLNGLSDREKKGENISSALAATFLSREAYAFLLRMTRVVTTPPVTVTPGEWASTYDILTQVQKARRYGQWRLEESGIVLGPDMFQVSDAPMTLPRWRATRQARDEWVALLQARTAERAALHDGYQALMSLVEGAALPHLRDTLVAAWGGHQVAADTADWLSGRLQLDVRGSGRLRTTRIVQATETLQSLLFSRRTGQLPQGHPAAPWQIADEAAFDDGWRWLSTYEAWQAAMLVFLYPENILLPALRPDTGLQYSVSNATRTLRKLITELRHRPRLTPEDARSLAWEYLVAQVVPLHEDVGGLRMRKLAHWPLNEGDGETAGDVSERPAPGSTGTLSGPVWVGGTIGRTLAFDGVDDRVTIAPSERLKSVTNTFSISFWARPESPHEIDVEGTTGSAVRGITGQRYAFGPIQGAAAFGDKHAGVGISVGTNGISVYEHSAHYMPAVLTYGAPITDWTHVVVIYEDRKPRLYVNSKLVTSRDQPSTMTWVHPCPDGLGGMEYGYYHGELLDVRVHSGALEQEQIKQLAFRITDKRSDSELVDLHGLSGWFGRWGFHYAQREEPFHFVPLALALELQASGQYVSALDWYQTVFAYHLTPEYRWVYSELGRQLPGPDNLVPWGDWTRRLNPHQVAEGRWNPYNRFVLMNVARCHMEFADTEFTRDTPESLARARVLYTTARSVLSLPDLQPIIDTNAAAWPLPNPAFVAMKARVEVQLAKLRQGRNIAGVQRALEIPSAAGLAPIPVMPSPSIDGPARPPAQLRPTPYRYRVLVERAKQLVALAEQVEAAYLSALEKYDNAAYRRFEANKGIALAEAGVTLQSLRVTEADSGVKLAEAQRGRAEAAEGEYQGLIDAGLNEYEKAMLDGYWNIKMFRDAVTNVDAAIGIAAAIQHTDWQNPQSFVASAVIAALHGARAYQSTFLTSAEERLQANTLLAGHARMVQGWELQRKLAAQDVMVAKAQITVARDHKAVATKEEEIAKLQATQAKATVEFLDRQFTNQELYAWMSGVLGGIYRYFLQQATALALMAQGQLAFERAESPASLVQADYWEPPAMGTSSNGPGRAPDRRGLTGSVRLLQDIHQLDQYAFETDKRRLNLSQTFSLAERTPLEFQLFRESGVLRFATPMQWFDEDFPGDYLRLIRRVSVSVVGLIPPGRGIRATLRSSGISRVVVGGDSFGEVVVRRDPEVVALSSPVAATGVFELDIQSELSLPFESTGVDTSWKLEMPHAANPFDFRSLGDVLMTLEYTALHSDDYRRQVIERLNRATRRTGDQAFSARRDFPDEYYRLLNPEPQTASGERTARLDLSRDDFPTNLDGLTVQDVVVYLAPRDGAELPEVAVTVSHAGRGGLAQSALGLFSTRRGNAGSWTAIRGTPVEGAWDLSLSEGAASLLDTDQVADLLLVVGYVGTAPQWPV